MLTSVPPSRHCEPFPNRRPNHGPPDTLPSPLASSKHTSSPDIGSALNASPTSHPATSPPNKTSSPVQRARTAQQSAAHRQPTHHLLDTGCRKVLSLATSETKISTEDDAATASTNTAHVAKVCTAVPERQPSLVEDSPCTVVAADSRSSPPARATGQHFLGGLTPRCVSPSKRLKV